MLFEKTYRYIAENGKMELTKFKMSPSQLRRAHIPEELISDYNAANGQLQAAAGMLNDGPDYDEQLQQIEKYQKEKFKALDAIENFLEDQEMLAFGEIDLPLIKKLLDSDVTGYEIEKQTGVIRSSIGKYRNGKASILNIPLKNAIKLTKYAKTLEELK